MSTCYGPDTVLGTRDAAVNRTDTNHCPQSPCILVGVMGMTQVARRRGGPGCGAVPDLWAPGAGRPETESPPGPV